MEENEFWIALWRTVAIAIVAIAVCVSGCTAFQTKTIQEMTASGSNPLDAACAIKPTDRECIVRFAK